MLQFSDDLAGKGLAVSEDFWKNSSVYLKSSFDCIILHVVGFDDENGD